MSKVRAFKMITGEELVARVDDNNTLDLLQEEVRDIRDVVPYRLKKPHVMQIQQVAPGKFGLAMVPWTLSNPDLEVVTIHASHVVFSFDVSPSVEKQFVQQTSGIELASTVQPNGILKS